MRVTSSDRVCRFLIEIKFLSAVSVDSGVMCGALVLVCVVGCVRLYTCE